MTTTTTSSQAFTESQWRAVHRILDSMDRAAQRTEKLYSRVRKHARKSYRGPLTIFIPHEEHDTPPANGQDGCCPAWSYSLSQGGVGLIALECVSVPEFWVGVQLPNNTMRWMNGRIVRRRRIPEEDFFDYGVSFAAKATETGPEGDEVRETSSDVAHSV